MKDIRVPGVAWAVGLIIAIALIHENEAYLLATYGLEPFYLDLLIGLLIGVLKTLSLGTEQLNQALDVIDRLLARKAKVYTEEGPKEGMRGYEEGTPPPLPLEVQLETIPPRPNPVVRWLLG